MTTDGQTLTQKQPNKKRQRKHITEKSTREYRRLEQEILELQLYRARRREFGERQLIEREGYRGYLA